MALKNIIKAALFTPGVNGRWGLPIILMGKPGTSKTAQIADISYEAQLQLETVIASLRDPTDFQGMPGLSQGKDGKTYMEYYAVPFAKRAAALDRGLIFLDEMNTAPESVFAAMLRMVLEGVVGDLALPSGIRFIAAMNSVEDAAGGRTLPPPLANRFGHFDFDAPTPDSWGDWLLGGAGDRSGLKVFDPAAEEARVMAEWDSPWAKARGVVAGFVRKFPAMLHNMPPANDPRSSKAFATPRSWEMACRALASAEVHKLDPVEVDTFLQGFVGEAAATQFVAYRKAADLPDPLEVLDGKVAFKHDERKLDKTLAVLSSCAAMVASPTLANRDARADRLWTIIDGVVDSAADVAVPATRALVQAKVRLFTKHSSPVLTKLNPVLVAAGLIKEAPAASGKKK